MVNGNVSIRPPPETAAPSWLRFRLTKRVLLVLTILPDQEPAMVGGKGRGTGDVGDSLEQEEKQMVKTHKSIQTNGRRVVFIVADRVGVVVPYSGVQEQNAERTIENCHKNVKNENGPR